MRLLDWFNCRILGSHTWTSAAHKGQEISKEQLQRGAEGMKEYIKLYCEVCGEESKLSKKFRNEFN